MPDVLVQVMGWIVNGFAVFGAISLAALVYRLSEKRKNPTWIDSQRVLHRRLTETIDQEAEEQQEAITEAVTSTQPADELAELGNDRR